MTKAVDVRVTDEKDTTAAYLARADHLAEAAQLAGDLTRALGEVIRGKPEALGLSVAALLSGGHLLIQDVPGAEPIVGLDGYRAMMDANYAGLVGFHVTLDDQFSTDDRVVCRWRLNGTHGGELFGMPATGKHIEFAGVSLWEFEAGKARRGWVFPDLASAMAQLQS